MQAHILAHRLSPDKMSSDHLNADNDDYDEAAALEYAIALSLQDNPSPDLQNASVTTTESSSSARFGSLQLDRKKMEEERLARQLKRSADDAQLEQHTLRRRLNPASSSLAPPTTTKTMLAKPVSSLSTVHKPSLSFPRGAVKRTWVTGTAKEAVDISIEEVLDKDNLQMGVLSSFQWDEPWILSKVDLAKTRLILIAYAGSEAEVSLIRPLKPGSYCANWRSE